MSTELTVSSTSSASATSGSTSHQLPSAGSETRSKIPTDEGLIRHPLSSDLTLKSGDVASDSESDPDTSASPPPPPYELATELSRPILTSKPRQESGLTGLTGTSTSVDTGSRPNSETKVESEKPKFGSLRNFSADESSTDPIYSTDADADGSVLSFGASEILPDGLHRLEAQLVRRLNNLEDVDNFEPRPLVFNIPQVSNVDEAATSSSTSSTSSNEDIVVLQVDTTTSVI